jgi:hypothetical protein
VANPVQYTTQQIFRNEPYHAREACLIVDPSSGSVSVEVQVNGDDGESRWLEVTDSPFDTVGPHILQVAGPYDVRVTPANSNVKFNWHWISPSYL